MKLEWYVKHGRSSERTSSRASGLVPRVVRKPSVGRRLKKRKNRDVLEPGGLNVERVR